MKFITDETTGPCASLPQTILPAAGGRHKRYAAFILAMALVSVAGCASHAAKEGKMEANEDVVITNKVIKALNNEASLKSSALKVETSKGVVLLTGFVNSAADENTATEITRYIKGVTLVRDAIEVQKQQ